MDVEGEKSFVLTLDGLGTRYHMLPSQVLNQATTLDLYIMEKALILQRQREDPTWKPQRPEPSQSELMAILRQAKESK